MSEQGWNAIALSIPISLLLIGLEILIERRALLAAEESPVAGRAAAVS